MRVGAIHYGAPVPPTRAQDGLSLLSSALLWTAPEDVLVWSEPDELPLDRLHLERGGVHIALWSEDPRRLALARMSEIGEPIAPWDVLMVPEWTGQRASWAQRQTALMLARFFGEK